VLDESFLGKSAADWEAIAATVAAFASLTNTAIVAAVAFFTFKYMQSTKELVRVSKQQSEASIRQADASIKTLEVMNVERRETDSFQRAVFIHSTEALDSVLMQYRNLLFIDAKPWHMRDCDLEPQEWGTCRAFVSRKAPESLDEMLKIEIDLQSLASAIQGPIKAPDSQWHSTVQRRKDTSQRIDIARKRIGVFSGKVLQMNGANATSTLSS
jgi:hypothetical protein